MLRNTRKTGRGAKAADALLNRGFIREVRKNHALFVMVLPAFVFLIVFNYIPMYGIQVAFRKFNFMDGITKSPWVGLDNFKFYFNSKFFWQTTFNTLFINVLTIVFWTFMAVSTAILISEIPGRRSKKIFQTSMFFPYFISWVVVSAFIRALLNDRFGLVNNMITSMGGEGVPWLNIASIWPYMLAGIATWRGLGYSIVIYLAKIVGMDSEIIEAARVDGANKWQEITMIILPGLKTTIVLLSLISLGQIFVADFGMIYSIIGDNGMLLPTTDVINTYIFRAMRLQGQFGIAAAVGLYQSVMGFALVLITNHIVRRHDKDMALF